MQHISGYVLVLKRPHNAAYIYGSGPRVLGVSLKEFVPFQTVSQAAILMHKRIAQGVIGEFFVSQITLHILEGPLEEFKHHQGSLIVFWKGWHELRENWRIAGKSGSNFLISLEPYHHQKTALSKLMEVRKYGGLATLGIWHSVVTWSAALDDVYVEQS